MFMSFQINGNRTYHLDLIFGCPKTGQANIKSCPNAGQDKHFFLQTCPKTGQPFRRLKCFTCPKTGQIYYI